MTTELCRADDDVWAICDRCPWASRATTDPSSLHDERARHEAAACGVRSDRWHTDGDDR